MKTGRILIFVLLLLTGYEHFIAIFLLYRLIKGLVREDLKPDSFPGLRESWASWEKLLHEPVLVPSPRPPKASRPHTFRPGPSPASRKWMPGRPLVLVNESDECVRDLIAQVLKCEGYRVVVGSDGETAVRLAHSLMPDLIIINAMLDKKHGGVVNEELKGDQRTASIKVLLLSNRRALAAFLTEPEGFIEKPFDINDLIQTVARLIGRPLGE